MVTSSVFIQVYATALFRTEFTGDGQKGFCALDIFDAVPVEFRKSGHGGAVLPGLFILASGLGGEEMVTEGDVDVVAGETVEPRALETFPFGEVSVRIFWVSKQNL